MSALAERLLAKYYRGSDHPYSHFERRVESLLRPDMTVLDAGCGRGLSVLRKFVGRAARLIGVELVEFTDVPAGIETYLRRSRHATAARAAWVIPNRFHGRIVHRVEGRAEEDSFPTAYRTNIRSAIQRPAAGAGLEVTTFTYLSQHSNYFMFNAGLFFLGMCYERLISRYEALRFLRGWLLVTPRKP
jgi:hypothetical protein